jgi:2-succinyl-6-hydroxy-2,4-cyclohexadiene-1-carboxylate synthase
MEKTDLIIAIHGFLGKPQDWNFQLRNYIKTNTKIITPSLFTEGEWSPRKSLTDWNDFFLTQCEQWHHEGYNIKLFAYSLGGRLVLGPYLKNPSLFTEAHFLSVNPGLISLSDIQLRKKNDLHWAQRFLNEPWDTLISNWNSQAVFNQDSEPERKESDFNRELLSLALTQWSVSQQENYWNKLMNLKKNINWWVGEKDSKFLTLGKNIIKNNKKIKLHIVPNCGHRLLCSKSHFLI